MAEGVADLAWDGSDCARWVRPVSSYGNGELTYECFYVDCSEPQLLDVIELEYETCRPPGCHVEDVLIDSGKRWKKAGTITYQEAVKLASLPLAPLWLDGSRSSNGVNDKIDAPLAVALKWRDNMTNEIFTIGHSNHTTQQFLALLQAQA